MATAIQHTVVFRLRHLSGSPEEGDFLAAARSLATIPGVEDFHQLRQVSPKSPFTFFFTAQAHREGKRANELSSAEAGSSGTVTIHEASCGPNPTLSLDIAGTLGSEVEQQALAIEGSYHS